MQPNPEQREKPSWTIPILIGIVSFLVRCWFISEWPDSFQYDAYQRWAAREHLFVQVWLPAAQIWVWLVGLLDGTPLQLRYLFAALSSLSLTLGARLAQQISNERAALFFLPMICFGPYIVWGSAPYQESTLLLLLFSALLLFRSHPRASDLLMGGLALVRYEGWPLLMVHLYLRRSWWALLSLWGVVLYFALKITGLAEPYAASPDSFDDWKGLSTLTLEKVPKLLRSFWNVGYNAGAFWIFGFSLLAFIDRKLLKEETMLTFTFLGQIAAVAGWLFSLGIAFSRMFIILTLPAAILAAAALSRSWPKLGKMKFALVGGLLILSAWSFRDAYTDHKYYRKSIRWEIELVKEIKSCPEETWAIHPRPHPGPRERHDGCEVIQGLSNLKVKDDFECLTWDWGGPEATLKAVWNKNMKQYQIQRIRGEQSEGCSW